MTEPRRSSGRRGTIAIPSRAVLLAARPLGASEREVHRPSNLFNACSRLGRAYAIEAEGALLFAEPPRLQLLNCLQGGELTVNVVEETVLGQANVSKHSQLLHNLGVGTRRKEGLFVYYALADASVFKLCDIMCGRIQAQLSARGRRFAL